MKTFKEYITEVVVNKPYKVKTYLIPTWATYYMQYGEIDGNITNEEIVQIDDFMKENKLGIASLEFSEEVQELCRRNDITGRKDGDTDCVEVTASWFWNFSIECGEGWTNETVGQSFSKNDIVSFFKMLYDGTNTASSHVKTAVNNFRKLQSKFDKNDDIKIRIFDSHKNVSNGLVYVTFYEESDNGNTVVNKFDKQLTDYMKRIK